MKNQITLTIAEDSVSKRLDRYVCDFCRGESMCSPIGRTMVQTLIKENSILVNNKSSKASYKLKANDVVFILLPDLKEPKAKPEKIPLDIAFEDDDLIVVNKSQGMITHPTSRIYRGTLVNALLYHCKDSLSGINGVLRPGIVHRLDKETSGLIIVCKNDKSHNEIAKQFKERKIKKYYLAIVHRVLKYDKGTINKPIGRHKTQRQKMAVVNSGRNAITHFKLLKKVEAIHELPLPGKYTLMECIPETGRTHQIRVHLTSIGHPIVGDRIYGTKNDPCELMMLHAYKLIFIHPKTGKQIALETEIPDRMVGFLNNCRDVS